jgi:hypothetical protein
MTMLSSCRAGKIYSTATKLGQLVYENTVNDSIRSRPGFSELMENLTWARDHCGGRFNVIIAKAKDPNAEPRLMILSRLSQHSIREALPGGAESAVPGAP